MPSKVCGTLEFVVESTSNDGAGEFPGGYLAFVVRVIAEILSAEQR